jgi:hypothetical protein
MSKPRAAVRAAGWVTVGAVLAGGVATAATTTGSGGSPAATTAAAAVPAANTPSTTPSAKAGKGKGKGGPLGKLRRRLLHGQVTVLGKNGQPEVYAEQRGTVSAVTPTSITIVTAKDNNFTQQYVVNSTTRVRVDGKKSDIGNVKTGQPAIVVAKVDGTTQTAAYIVERAKR